MLQKLAIITLTASILIFMLQSCSTDPDMKQSVADQPQKKDATDIIDEVYHDSKDTEATIKALEENDIVSMDPESRLIYAILLYSQGKVDTSEKIFQQLTTEDSTMARAWLYLARIANQREDKKESNMALQKALAVDSNLPEALVFQGNMEVAENMLAKAEISYRNALKTDPDYVEALVGLGWTLAKGKKHKESLAVLDKAVKLAPNYAYARVDRSRVNRILGNYKEAENDLTKAIELEPDNAWNYLDRAKIRIKYFANRKGALSDLNNVIRIDPDNFMAAVYLAGLYDDLRNFKLSEQYYTQVLELRPNYIWAYRPLGKYAWMRGSYEEAEFWFDQAVKADPDAYETKIMLAFSKLKLKKTKEADALFTKIAQKFTPKDTEYEVIRFCRTRDSNYHVTNALNREINKKLRGKLWFYVGVTYEIMGNNATAKSVYEQITGYDDMEMEFDMGMEFDMAWAALHGMK